MKLTTVILVYILVCGPAFGREHKHAVRKAGALRAAVSAAEKSDDSDATDSDDADDTDDQPKNDDNDGVDTDDTDTGETNDTDDQDDNDNDDMDGNTTTAKTAIRNLLKASALKQSEKPLARLAAALNARLNAQQTIAQLLEPAGSGSAAATSDKTLESSGAGVAASATALPTAVESLSPTLYAAAVPEPAGVFLAATGVLPWYGRRRRS